MYEKHELEQYFFDDATVQGLADFLQPFRNPCCICAPRVGKRLVEQGIEARILDVDDRFSRLEGFRRYDLYRPEWLGEEFGIIFCDPPFFKVSLSQLFDALRILSRYDFRQPLLLAYLTRRSSNVVGTFAPFDLKPTGYHPGYQTVRKIDRNDVELFGNLGPDEDARLMGSH